MKIAVFGVGRMGLAHVNTLQQCPRVSRLFVADADAGRAHAAVASVPSAVAGDVDAAFAWRPDAVVIAAPTSVHAALIARAVDQGIPTFCEKPLAENLASTQAVVKALEGTEVPVQIGFQRRFDPGYIAARKALRDEAIGELRRVHMATCDPSPPPAGYIPTSGGIYRDCHVHDFDILRWVTGREVTSVYATGANRGADFFRQAGDVDESAALLTLDDGTLVTLQGSRYNGAGYDVRMELAGTRGSRCVGLDDHAPLTSAEPGVAFPAGAPWANFQSRFATAYRAELETFLAAAAGEIESPCDPVEALQAFYIAEAAECSRREARPVRLTEVQP